MSTERQSVFISYSHHDGLDFTRRLAFSLSMYMNVFWDRHIEAGPFPEQLYNEIESRDCFLLVMTPGSLHSEWCKKERVHAEKFDKKIALARVFEGERTVDAELCEKYTYGDFTRSFDDGFRRITQLFLKHPFSTWERFGEIQNNENLLELMRLGYIPGLICKQLSTVLATTYVWPIVKVYVSERGYSIRIGEPQTVDGIISMCDTAKGQFERYRDIAGPKLIQQIQDVLVEFGKGVALLHDDQHEQIGQRMYDYVLAVESLIESSKLRERRFGLYGEVKAFFRFNIAEILRQKINYYASTSRYLY